MINERAIEAMLTVNDTMREQGHVESGWASKEGTWSWSNTCTRCDYQVEVNALGQVRETGATPECFIRRYQGSGKR